MLILTSFIGRGVLGFDPEHLGRFVYLITAMLLPLVGACLAALFAWQRWLALPMLVIVAVVVPLRVGQMRGVVSDTVAPKSSYERDSLYASLPYAANPTIPDSVPINPGTLFSWGLGPLDMGFVREALSQGNLEPTGDSTKKASVAAALRVGLYLVVSDGIDRSAYDCDEHTGPVSLQPRVGDTFVLQGLSASSPFLQVKDVRADVIRNVSAPSLSQVEVLLGRFDLQIQSTDPGASYLLCTQVNGQEPPPS